MRAAAAGQAVETDRLVHRDGNVTVGGNLFRVDARLVGQTVTLRLDGHLMHTVADGILVGTWPCPVSSDRLPALRGVRATAGPLPPAMVPSGAMRVQRRVNGDGRIMVASQHLKLGKRNVGKQVVVVIEDTHFRILHEGEAIAVKERRKPGPLDRVRIVSKREDSQK
ncbi:hypothetical protein ABZ725_50820 [Streptomyces sp. NPDC006872]|uniref:hypothetical protein n=1 Tax=Streptomyces sp. NPDC006872 TaxID=3155720 RepID=UPI00340285E5